MDEQTLTPLLRITVDIPLEEAQDKDPVTRDQRIYKLGEELLECVEQAIHE